MCHQLIASQQPPNWPFPPLLPKRKKKEIETPRATSWLLSALPAELTIIIKTFFFSFLQIYILRVLTSKGPTFAIVHNLCRFSLFLKMFLTRTAKTYCAYTRVAVTARFNYIFSPSFLFTSFHPALISSRDDLDLVLGVGSFSLLAQ